MKNKKMQLLIVIAILFILMKPMILSSQRQSYMSQSVTKSVEKTNQSSSVDAQSFLSFLQLVGFSGLGYLLFLGKDKLNR